MNGQCARVLEVLSDGEGHSVTDIHARAGTMRLNSRVSELRKHLKERGETIVCTRAGGRGPDSYIYTLVSLRPNEQRLTDLGPDGGCSLDRSEGLGSTEPGGMTPPPGSGDPNHLVPKLPPGPGHASADGNRPASSGPAPDVDVEDLQLELDLIDRKINAGIVVDSENARSTHAILQRQKREIEARL